MLKIFAGRGRSLVHGALPSVFIGHPVLSKRSSTGPPARGLAIGAPKMGKADLGRLATEPNVAIDR